MNLNGDRDEINGKRKNSQGYEMNQYGETKRSRRHSGEYKASHQNAAVQEMQRNRINGDANLNPSENLQQLVEEGDDPLALTLRCGPSTHSLRDPQPQRQSQPPMRISPYTECAFFPPPSPPPLCFPHFPVAREPLLFASPLVEPPVGQVEVARQPRGSGSRRNPMQAPRGGKSETVPAPYPWATTRRAIVHSLKHLQSQLLTTITGEVQCKHCEKQYQMSYDLMEKFIEIVRFIMINKEQMHDRAPRVWMNPVLPTCRYCQQENSAKPVISEKKKEINWLFLFLGQTIGCCTLEQLKYFCKHTKNHRTGAKDRVLYLAYLGLCKQLDPSGPFDR